MKALSFSRICLVGMLILGLLAAWNGYSPQKIKANLIGGCERCDDNAAYDPCKTPCIDSWTHAEGTGDNYVHSQTYCTNEEIEGCSSETAKYSTFCATWPP